MLQERKRRGTKSAKAEGCGLTARISEPRLAAQNPHPFLPPQSTRLFYRASARAREARLGDPGHRKGGLQKAARKAQVVKGFRAYLIRFDTK